MPSENEYALDLFVGQTPVARLAFHAELNSFSLTYSPAWAASRHLGEETTGAVTFLPAGQTLVA
jgi:hypothetical protein